MSAPDATSFSPRERVRAFSLVELLISITVITVMLLFLVSMTDTVARVWTRSGIKLETSQSARASLELMTREMTPAVIGPLSQFVVFPGELLSECGCAAVAPGSQAALWMAPLGVDGDMRMVGYYLERVEELLFYRLKRIYIGPENEDYFPPGLDVANLDDPATRSSASDAGRFLGGLDSAAFDDRNPEGIRAVVSTVADGVIAIWIQCIDLLGNPIPWASESELHPDTRLMFNSAAFFQMATTTPFDNGSSFTYLPDHPQVMKGDRLPAAVEITLVTLDSRTLARAYALPEIPNVLTDNGVLDVRLSLQAFRNALGDIGIRESRTFMTRAKLAGAN
ncbi:MAG: type II secretion system protein J [Verrucomicrobiales bacterium]